MRIGMGYDVHRLVPDRDLIIGGVKIPYEKGLLGHSDADVMLHAVMDALLGAAALYIIGNIDATIIAQKPKMAPHIPQMRQNIAKALKISEDQINVKATTEEGLGFTGEGAGISSQAICLLEEIGNFGGRDVMYETSYDPSAGGCAGCCGCRQ